MIVSYDCVVFSTNVPSILWRRIYLITSFLRKNTDLGIGDWGLGIGERTNDKE
ncbi:MAG: hypothetical protein HEQ35_01435 [Gloeotrichia echinulata IR180]|jgi:hypothetical protein|nr:hypothetical protein [Gloeotrichia echinulata DEX184]